MTIRLDKFREASVLAGRSRLASDELLFMRTRLVDALEAHPKGNIIRKAMLHVFDADRIGEAILYEWQTEEGPTIWPGMDSVSFDEAVKASSLSKMLHQRIRVWEAMRTLVSCDGPDHSGWIIRCDDKDGNAAVQLRWREKIKQGWSDGIVVTMDATFSNDLVAPYFDRPLKVLPADEPILNHVNVLQVMDRSFAATSIIPAGDNDDKRRENHAREVWRWVWLRSIQYRGKGRDCIDVLVLCQLGLENLLRDLGMPPNADIAHFNDIRGLDQWGGVRCRIVHVS